MPQAILAGLVYFVTVFAAGFALGTLRVLVLAQSLGETASVILELPLILLISWFACRWIVVRFAVPATFPARFVMGLVALSLLLAAEAMLGIYGFGRTLAEHLARYANTPELLGLAGQILFALFPLLLRFRET